ncbi:hypothetical protein DL89DRAFT_254780 [Linderina pennispora]|uniref:Rhodanese domain-containing protein n=1 Tax=Linderina pennispora TaxID=61395 RepID=A0A1Y1WN92_9FUNG|nr:uncharacterized protein DL89DRAFT_254780 [Linderina pennispora]ORX75029.1 hypothetical protein DL89DRAFT_254780 [Linderina pennispora]
MSSAAQPLSFEQIRDIAESVSPDASKYVIIDVRNPGEFAAGHIKTAHNVPVSEIKEAIALPPADFQAKYGFDMPKPNDPERNVGGRARMAVSALADAKYTGNLYAYFPGWAEYSSKI